MNYLRKGNNLIPPHLSKAYKNMRFIPGSYPITEDIYSMIISLPIGYHITLLQQENVIQTIKKKIVN